jgi:hypothetical protein
VEKYEKIISKLLKVEEGEFQKASGVDDYIENEDYL